MTGLSIKLSWGLLWLGVSLGVGVVVRSLTLAGTETALPNAHTTSSPSASFDERSPVPNPEPSVGDALQAPCFSPLEPGCEQCLLRANTDGSSVVLSGGSQGYTVQRALAKLQTPLRPCATCRLEHRLTLALLAERKTFCAKSGTDVGCARFRTVDDFGIDPTFAEGSCEEYCWRKLYALSQCP